MGYIMARPDIIAKMMRYDGGMQSERWRCRRSYAPPPA